MLSIAFAVCVWGCSSGSDGTGGACNSLVNDAPLVTLSAVADTAPAPAGGSIAGGIYELSAMTLYTGPGGSTVAPDMTASAVIQIAGQTMQQVGSIDGAEKRYTSTFTISGTTISTTDTCPAPDTGSHSLTATSTEFRIYDANAQGALQQTYTMR